MNDSDYSFCLARQDTRPGPDKFMCIADDDDEDGLLVRTSLRPEGV